MVYSKYAQEVAASLRHRDVFFRQDSACGELDCRALRFAERTALDGKTKQMACGICTSEGFGDTQDRAASRTLSQRWELTIAPAPYRDD